MKRLLIILICLSPFFIKAQTFENQWAALFSYSNIVDLAEGNDRLIAASDNAVFTYDLITNEINTITTVQGLSGDLISTIYYSENFDIIVIGYSNGLIELILEDGSILSVIDILDKPTIPPNQKRINHFNEFNGNLYISTDFGISVYDLTALEFGDTYIIGDFGEQVKIIQTAVFDGYIYASIENKVKRALVNNSNLVDFNQWSTIFNFGNRGVQTFSNNLYLINSSNILNVFNGISFEQVATLPQINRKIAATNDFLTVTSDTHTTVFDANLDVVASIPSLPDYEYSLSNTLALNDKVYLGTKEHGVLEVPFGSSQATQILPAGPLLNKAVSIDATPGQLWAVFGEATLSFNPFPLNSRGISNFENNEWTNIPFEEVLGARSIVHVKINPNNPSQVYASSFFDGLLKIEDKTPTVLFNSTNSPLVNTLPDPPNFPLGSLRIFGSEFDRQGNLWFVQTSTDLAINKLTTTGQFQSFDVSSIIGDPFAERGLNNIDISREGFIFIASSENGLIGFNPTNNQFQKIGEDLGNGNLPDDNVRAIKIDNRNQAWIGTLRGLRVLFNVGGFFQEDANIDAQPIIILDNDGVAQELLFEQSITDIEVDGANNKWIATASSGVFYVSSNGQETLLRFNKDNSPLPSNNVLDIAIDPQSGVVYFATGNGLVAFNGTTTAPNPTLESLRAYPNPVRPNFNGNVTIDGLTARANVKITDVNGSLVFEQVSEGGSVQWDITAFGKYKVSSGVYFILVTADGAEETKIAKVMIIR
ncbi:MAG: T9SS type A sorting domain-containing protein [Flavobacteriaceae bacterium]